MLAAKWNFVNFQSPSYSAIMMEYTTPPSYGSTVVNVGGIATEGKILCAGSDNVATHTKVIADSQNDWQAPEEVRFVWRGLSKDKTTVNAVIEGSLGTRLDKVDVMAKIPGFIKAIVGGVVGTKPYIYQVWKIFSIFFAPFTNTQILVCPSGKVIHQSDDGWKRDCGGRGTIFGGNFHFLNSNSCLRNFATSSA